jgi:tetratricopeptide (TPR) repeat protein
VSDSPVRRFLAHTLLILAGTAPIGAVPAVSAFAEGNPEALRIAQEQLAAKDAQAAAQTAVEALRKGADDARLCEVYARALSQLNRRDEAAHWFEEAARRYASAEQAAPSKACLAELRRNDPLSSRRDALLAKLAATLTDAASDLEKQGHTQRALEILERLPPIASGKTLARVEELLARVRGALNRLDLDAETAEDSDSAAPSAPGPSAPARPVFAPGSFPITEHESQRYKLVANLEPELVTRVGELMDSLFGFYVQVFFDGELGRARGAKATIRIHGTREDMLKDWQGGPGPEGWWSSGENAVHCYDSRTNGSGSLDWMLETLYHEASHQFTSLLSQGGFVPAWLNEGTASFFEGTVAMADNRVLWPEAAEKRLASLCAELAKPDGVRARQVVAYDSPASYPATYYAFGWGLVYFLQQYEDKDTLALVYRPLYAQYMREVLQSGGGSMPVFERVFLGPNSPLKHTRFEDFERDWTRWILEELRPLHGSDARARELRLARMRACLERAALAPKEGKQAPVPESELLNRALSHLEFVRARIDKADKPDGELLVLQAEILERLKRPQAAAPLLEDALELAARDKFELDEARRTELENRLKRLDSKNATLRTARIRSRELARSVGGLLKDYVDADPGLPLRAYTLAALSSGILREDESLRRRADELREEARKLGLLLGSIRELAGPRATWKTVFAQPPKAFNPAGAEGAIELSSVRLHGEMLTTVSAVGEYEVRARLERRGRIELGAAHGLVIVGRPDADWYAVGIDEKGQGGLWTVRVTARGGTVAKRLAMMKLEKPVQEGETLELAVRVFPDGRVELRAGNRAVVSDKIPLDGAVPRHCGVFVKNGAATFREAVVEIFP